MIERIPYEPVENAPSLEFVKFCVERQRDIRCAANIFLSPSAEGLEVTYLPGKLEDYI